MGDGTWGSRYIPPAMRRDEPDNFDLAPPEPLPADPETVLAALDPLLTDARRARIEHVIAARARAVVAVLDGLIDPHNVSAVLRSADAFGVQQVHLIARADPFLASPRVSQGADRWVDVIRHASPRACVSALHALGYKVYVAAMDGALRPEALADAPKVAIVFGNEMQGFVQSLNVSVAAAITLFAATRGRPGDLEASERQLLRARYTLLSVPRAGEIVAEYQRRQAR
jgi:tRNA (guanosine-2'-O-)-methyltransferase